MTHHREHCIPVLLLCILILAGRGHYEASGADYAEWFQTIQSDLLPGEIVCVDEQNARSVKRCSSTDEEMVGIVSTKPAFIGNAREPLPASSVQVGLIGQIPVMVTGTVAIGDLIGLSSSAGIGKTMTNGRPTICTAMEARSGAGTSTILCALSRYASDRAGDASDTASFTDTTAESLSTSTIDLWNGTYPNIRTDSTASTVLVAVVIKLDSDGSDDELDVFNLRRTTNGSNPTCASTQVGADFSASFTTNTTDEPSASAIFLDSPGVEGTIKYTVCSNPALTSGTDSNDTERIDVTLVELGG